MKKGATKTSKRSAERTIKGKAATKKTAGGAAEKGSVNNVSKKKQKKKPLVHADRERCFWVHTGVVLENLRDLKTALHEMSDKEFSYHVNIGKNDFATWVESVLGDEVCARALHRARRRKTAHTYVVQRLTQYSRR